MMPRARQLRREAELMKKHIGLVNVGLILIALVLGAVLISGHTRKPVFAQSEGEVGNIIAVAGQDRPRDDEPLFLIDTKDQVLLAYEYQIQTNWFSLRGVRRIEYDMIDDDMMFARIGKSRKVGPKVSDVQELIEKEAKK